MITIGDIGGDKRILIGQDYCGRAATCLLNHNWTRLRIAMRLCVSDSTTDAPNIGTPPTISPDSLQANFMVGLASGPSLLNSYPPTGVPPSHAVMFRLIGDYGAWHRQPAGGGNPVSYLRQFALGQIWVGGTLAQAPTNLETSSHYLGATDANRTLLFCDIIKGLPPHQNNWTLNYFRNGDPACTDVDQTTFETQSLIVSSTVLHHGWAGGSTIVGVNESANGYFTHVNIFWNQAAAILKISDLRVIVLTTL